MICYAMIRQLAKEKTNKVVAIAISASDKTIRQENQLKSMTVAHKSKWCKAAYQVLTTEVF